MLPNCNCVHLATIHVGATQKIYVRKCKVPTTETDPDSYPHGR
jgi:hypothetical protein